MNKLSDKMQSRLDEWRKTSSSPPIKQTNKAPYMTNHVSRRDYGDDISDYERKVINAWREEPYYSEYRGRK